MIKKKQLDFQLSKPLKIGLAYAINETDKKRIYLVNWQCCISCIVLACFVSFGFFFDERLITFWSLIGYASFLLVLLLVLVFQAYGYLGLARWVLTISSFINGYVFELYVHSELLYQFYYILPALFSLFLFESRWISHFFFLVSQVLFFDLFRFTFFERFNLADFHFGVFFFVLYFLTLLIVTTNENSEKQLKAQKDELKDLNRFQKKFFINISHELRTPLTLIDGFANQSIQEGVFNKELSTKIVTQSHKMSRIIDDIMGLSKASSGKLKMQMENLDVAALLLNVSEGFVSIFKQKGLQLNIDVLGKSGINADPLFFERVINNLLLNSLKFTEKGETLIHLSKEENFIIIKIQDTGIGIPHEDLERVFLEFYQVKNDINQTGGSGVGLSFAKNIIELHKGELTLASTLGKGTSVKIKLPSIPLNLPEKIISINKQESLTSKKNNSKKGLKNILLVEDHDEMRNYICSLLNGYNIIESTNGIEALEILSTQTIDFVITDYMMSKMNGYELIKQIKAKNYNIPILMLTARTDIKGKLEVLRLGIDDYMTKPFSSEELLVRIENALFNYEEKKSYKETVTITDEPKATSSFVHELHDFVFKNHHNNLFGLDDIKEEFALSSSSLYRKIKSETGMSPNGYVREIRLQSARRLLSEEQPSNLKTIAISVGFKNTSYFSRQYKARFGTELSKELQK